MKMRNVAFALLLAVASISTSAVFSQNENTNDELSFLNGQNTMVTDGDAKKASEVNGVFIPD